MPYTAPTRDEFIALFPEFEDTNPDAIDHALIRGGRNVDENWFEDDYQEGLMLYAAHTLTLEQNAFDSGGEGRAIINESLGPISVGYDRVAAAVVDPSGFGATSYGQRYYNLLKQNRGGPRVT